MDSDPSCLAPWWGCRLVSSQLFPEASYRMRSQFCHLASFISLFPIFKYPLALLFEFLWEYSINNCHLTAPLQVCSGIPI